MRRLSLGVRNLFAADVCPILEGTMAGIRLFNIHYVWEDCVSMGLGALIVLTSWIGDDAVSQTAAANATIVGILVLALGASEVVDLRRWEEGLEAACGLWLIASPFVFGYADAGTVRYWHFAFGIAVVLLAVLELRQDWKLSDAELAQHSGR
jgi:SPW repeat-containing protein